MIEMQYKGRNGTLREYEIVCDTKQQAEELAGLSTYWRADGCIVSGAAAKRDIERMGEAVERLNTQAETKQDVVKPDNSSERVVVPEGKYRVGDEINGRRIVGLGRSWRPGVDDYSLYNIAPWVDRVQYAYFD